jgi:ATP-binding cassette subfamily B protein
VVDSISNIGNIRSFARHGHEHAHLRQMAAENAGHDRALQWQVLWMRMFQDASIVLFVGAIVAALVYLYRLGMVTAGDFAMLLTVAVATFQTIWYLASQFVDFAEEWGRCRQALAVIAMPHEIVDAPGAQPLQVARGRIEFERVTFRHQRNDNLFEDKSVVIEAGQKVGLVGLSGSGKTTFANLILRLYEIQSGRILIDGQDIARVTQESLHRSIALIPQDTSLFHRSLMENIRYGRLDASDAEVIEAARRAHCDDFIGRLPEKYATLVGERGLKLSGGQRQRIAIARPS